MTLHQSFLSLERQLENSQVDYDSIADAFALATATDKLKLAYDLLSLGLTEPRSREQTEAILSIMTDSLVAPSEESHQNFEKTLLERLPEVAIRFELLDRIGSGGMGVVYQARDLERNSVVAMKFLHRPHPEFLLCFKSEFRSLCHLAHRNLVRLYEFFHQERFACFTMEYVEGTNLITWWKQTSNGSPTPPYDVLCEVFLQLAEGIHHLHQDQKLHRDIKASNVMVTAEGRVTVLDFGLVTSVADSVGIFNINNCTFGGTVPYMPPTVLIQGQNAQLTPATDWYAFGVLLYETLSGNSPFQGKYSEIIERKQKEAAPPLPDSIPKSLRELCTDLLKADDDERAGFEEVSGSLKSGTGSADTAVSPIFRKAEIVGRAGEQRTLRQAYISARNGHGGIVFLHGVSGIGKTAILESFQNDLNQDDVWSPIVLSGRCYEQEYIPYRGIDEIVDQLAIYLSRLNKAEVESILPGRFNVLKTVFPAFELVDVAEHSAEPFKTDPSSQRKELLAAFCELAANVSRLHPLVVLLDDLQWSDSDSATIILSLLEKIHQFPILLVCSFRRKEAEQHEALRSIRTRSDSLEHLNRFDIPIDELDSGSLLSLAGRYSNRSLETEKISLIVTESKGNPFLLIQLASSVDKGEPHNDLDSILRSRLQSLSANERRFLDLVVIAGRPISREIIMEAAQISTNEHEVESNLRTGNWIKSSGPRTWQTIEPYHDRIRESLVSDLRQDKKQELHQSLAKVLFDYHILDKNEDRDQKEKIIGLHPAFIAHQCTSAGMIEEAIPLWREACLESLQRSAYSEVISQADIGLRLLGEHPELDLKEEEFVIRTTKATALITTKGYSAEEAGIELGEAAVLIDGLNDSATQIPALCGLWVFNLMRGQMTECREYAHTILRIAESVGDPRLLIEGHWRLGTTYHWMGNLEKATDHLEKAVAMYDPELHAANAFIYGQDPGVASRVYLTFALSYSGDISRAEELQQEALDLAEKTKHPHSMAWALSGCTMFRLGLGDFDGTIEAGTRTIEFSQKYSQQYWLVVAQMLVGWARVHKGANELAAGENLSEAEERLLKRSIQEGMDSVGAGFEQYRQMGTLLIQPFFYSVLADCSARNGDFEKAWEQVESGLRMAEQNMELNSKTGLLLVKAELILRRKGDFEEAEKVLLECMKTAEEQGSKLRSLQAAGALISLYRKLERHQDADNLLTPIMNWLAENGEKRIEDFAKQFIGGFN